METNEKQNLNQIFLETVENSFNTFINVGGTSRKPAKLKPLHGTIAKNIADMLGEDYIVMSQGYGKGKDAKLTGATHDKQIDIAIQNKHTKEFVAVIEVKYVMQNYKQNAINYFETMRGATENIRLTGVPCFQVFIVPDRLPYFTNNSDEKGKLIKHWEEFNGHNADKYIKLSNFNPDKVFGIPDNTLLYVVHITPEIDEQSVTTNKEYLEFYRNNTPTMELSKNVYPDFNPNGSVIYNDYEKFMNKVYNTIISKKYADFNINLYKI
jgi:hypothetical protein